MLNMKEEAVENASLPPDLRRAEIVVIPKLEKPQDKCASYRPISLLNREVTILAKTLAERLQG